MSGKINVTRFGLHQNHSGIEYLHQHSGTGHNFVGFPEPSPFNVAPLERIHCPHNINVNVGMPDRFHWEFFRELYEDPFFKAMLPIPKGTGDMDCFYVNDSKGEWVTMAVLLSRLSSPVNTIVMPFDGLSVLKVSQLMGITNVAPLVLTGIRQEHQTDLNEIVSESQMKPRRLVLLGEGHVIVRKPMVRIKTNLDAYDPHRLIALPMESLGAVALKRFCRHEAVNGAFVKKGVDNSDSNHDNS